MNTGDVAELLTLAAGYDGRQLAESEVRAWYEILARYDYEPACEAVVEHYTHQAKRVMPADVVRYCRARANEAAERHLELPPVGAGVPRNVQELLAQAKARYVVEDDAGEVWWRGPAPKLRATVLGCPAAAQRLTLPPLSLTSPDRWNGYVPPRTWGGRYDKGLHNRSHERKQLVEIVRIAVTDQQEIAS